MRYIAILLTGIITSCFFFPFEFRFLPGINTKMMVAVVGLMFAVLQMINRRDATVSKNFFNVSIIAAIFSFISYYAVAYNNTNDFSYVTYIISMWVWFFAAYAACFIIAQIHGTISVKLVVDYLIGIAVFQCVIALMIEFIPPVKLFVDAYIDTEIEIMDRINRLYGIGAALDVAGGKFSSILLMIGVIMSNYDDIRLNKKAIMIYSSCFVLIGVIGSMIARTTYIGLILALVYIIYRTGIWKKQIKTSNLKFWRILMGVIFILVLVCIYFYNTSPAFREFFRFGFEGFVNWVETGTWQTGSSEILQSMVVYPESLKTWLIGDGYLVDPNTGTYYMSTDIGYLRFIFYCGIIGLLAFSSMFVYLTSTCYRMYHQEKHLFLLLLILVFAIWAKVSTDLFLVYAIFICIPIVQKYTNNHLLNKL